MPSLAFSRLLVILACLCAATPHAQEGPTEEVVKASFVYNFGKFTQWPPETLSVTPGLLILCLSGTNDRYLAELVKMEGKTIQEREIRTKWAKSDFKGCHIVAFGSGSGDAKQVNLATRAGALTIGEGEEFGQAGGMIALINVGKRVQFDINIEAARQVGIQFSAQILKLARSVK